MCDLISRAFSNNVVFYRFLFLSFIFCRINENVYREPSKGKKYRFVVKCSPKFLKKNLSVKKLSLYPDITTLNTSDRYKTSQLKSAYFVIFLTRQILLLSFILICAFFWHTSLSVFFTSTVFHADTYIMTHLLDFIEIFNCLHK